MLGKIIKIDLIILINDLYRYEKEENNLSLFFRRRLIFIYIFDF